MTIVEFLEARLQEDEATALLARGDDLIGLERLTRDVDAKRAIIAAAEASLREYGWNDLAWPREGVDGWLPTDGPELALTVLQELVAVYREHIDFDDSWLPGRIR